MAIAARSCSVCDGRQTVEQMQAIQIFETSLRSADTDHFFHAIIIPKRSLPAKRRLIKRVVLDCLSLEAIEGVNINASNLVMHLAILLSESDPTNEEQRPDRLIALQHVGMESSAIDQQRDVPPFRPTRQDELFAQHVAFERIIPIEQSLSRESLATLVVRAAGRSKDFVAAVTNGGGNDDPILLLSVPEGVILCGRGDVLGYAFEYAGRKGNLLSWLAAHAD